MDGDVGSDHRNYLKETNMLINKYQKVPLGTVKIVATDFNPLDMCRKCNNGFYSVGYVPEM